jgi:hypothetical protein
VIYTSDFAEGMQIISMINYYVVFSTNSAKRPASGGLSSILGKIGKKEKISVLVGVGFLDLDMILEAFIAVSSV